MNERFFSLGFLRQAVLMGLWVLALMACSSQRPAQDWMTDSDESPTRKRARIHLELATGYFQKSQYAVALDEVKLALKDDPNDPDAYSLRGLIYWALQQTQLARDSFQKALDLNPQHAQAQQNWAWFECQGGRYAEAFVLFDRLLADPLYTARARTLGAYGLCLMRQGQAQAAEQKLQQAYELDSINPVVAYNLAVLFFQRAEWQRAQLLVLRLNKSAQANAESLWLGVKIERRLQQNNETSNWARALRERYPSSREAHLLEQGAFDD